MVRTRFRADKRWVHRSPRAITFRSTEPPKLLSTLRVRPAARMPEWLGPRGHVKAGMVTLACALGGGGVTRAKREGDRATPAGRFSLLSGYYRADKMARPHCRTLLEPIACDLGWCDDPRSALYNRPASLPLAAGHEVMWRRDGLYDVVFALDHNIHPRRVGRGSAIFLHCAKPGYAPTLGCVALCPADMRRLLPRLSRRAVIHIG